MNPNKKILITILSFVLALVVIACSCSSLIPSGLTNQETMPGLAGKWQADTEDTYDIAWQNGQYVVLSCTYQGTSYDIVSQSWTGSSLTWSYSDTDLNVTVTLTTTSLSGDTLDVDWSESNGETGTTTLTRVQ